MQIKYIRQILNVINIESDVTVPKLDTVMLSKRMGVHILREKDIFNRSILY